MSVIKKPDLKIFAQDAKTGEVETFPDILRGWGVTLDRTAGKPPLEWFNAIGKRVDEWLMYLTQRGVAEWDTTLSYPKTAIVQFNSVVYVSIKETKGEQPDKSQASWSTLGVFLGLGNYYNKTESDTKFQPKGNYAPAGNYQPAGDYATNTALANGLALKFNSSGGYLSGSINVNGTTEALSVRLSSSGSTRKINFFPPQADSEEAYFQYVDERGWSGRVKIPIVSGVSMLYSTGNTTTDSSGFVRTGSKTALITDNVVQAVGTSTSNVMSQKAVTDALLGVNQNWVDVKSQRSANTDYTNSTGKPIFVSIGKEGGGNAGALYINGVRVGSMTSGDPAMTISAIVPAGGVYKYTSTNIAIWVELR